MCTSKVKTRAPAQTHVWQQNFTCYHYFVEIVFFFFNSLYSMSFGLKIQKFIWLMVQNFIASSHTYIE